MLAGCNRPQGTARAGTGGDQDYAAPPTVESAVRVAGGAVRLAGHAPSEALIQLHAPDGGQATARADLGGAWALDLPPSEQPRLYAFEAVSGRQSIRGEGALAVMPAPALPALILRAGFATEAIGPVRTDRLQLIALDYDGSGAAVGGFAPMHSRIRLAVDGKVLGEAAVDSQGRFAVLAVDPGHHVAPGPHQVRVYTSQGLAVDRSVTVSDGEIGADQAFTGSRGAGGWRVIWRLPGGGVQTSLIFDDAIGTPAPAGRAP